MAITVGHMGPGMMAGVGLSTYDAAMREEEERRQQWLMQFWQQVMQGKLGAQLQREGYGVQQSEGAAERQLRSDLAAKSDDLARWLELERQKAAEDMAEQNFRYQYDLAQIPYMQQQRTTAANRPTYTQDVLARFDAFRNQPRKAHPYGTRYY